MIVNKKPKNAAYTKTRAQDSADLCRYIRDARSHMTARPTATQEPEKVICTGALNFSFAHPDAQISEMAGLASKARSGDPITHFVISWPSNEHPTPAQLHEAARIFVREIGMDGYQVVYGAHKNTENIHLHFAINRVNPQTLHVDKINKAFDRRATSRAICVIEHVQGWQPEKNAVYQYTPTGPVLNQGREKGLSDTARAAERRTGETSLERRARAMAPEIGLATGWQDLHLRLAASGVTYEKRKGGAVLKFGSSGFIKASLAGRECSLRNLEKRFGSEFERARIAPKPYEPKPPVIRKDANIVDLLLATLLKLFGFHSAARKILHTKQALEREELRKAKFQSAQTRWAAQSVLKEEHASQRAALAAQQEKEIQSVKSMSKQELIQYCEEKQFVNGERKMDRKEIFTKFAAAMGADRYRITSKLDAPAAGMTQDEIDRSSFVFGKREDIAAGVITHGDASRGFTAEEVREWMPKIEAYGDKQDRGTYVTPLAAGVHYIVVDDIKTPEQLQAVRALEPAYIGESSRGSFQAVLKIYAHNDPTAARKAANAVTAELNKAYGDPAVRNGVQAFRLPGFHNHKLKHLENGLSPLVTMHHAENIFSAKTQAIYDNYVKKLELENQQQTIAPVQETPAQAQGAPAQEVGEWSKKGVRFLDLYGIHAKDAIQSMQRNGLQAPTGRNLDYAVGIRLRACGYSEAETAKILSGARHYTEVRRGDTPHQGDAAEAERGAAVAHAVYHSPLANEQLSKQAHHAPRWLQREKTAIKDVRAWYKKENIDAPEPTHTKKHEMER